MWGHRDSEGWGLASEPGQPGWIYAPNRRTLSEMPFLGKAVGIDLSVSSFSLSSEAGRRAVPGGSERHGHSPISTQLVGGGRGHNVRVSLPWLGGFDCPRQVFA